MGRVFSLILNSTKRHDKILNLPLLFFSEKKEFLLFIALLLKDYSRFSPVNKNPYSYNK